VIRFLIVFALAWTMAGCNKRSGEALVLAKEHIDAGERVEPSATPGSADNQPVRAMRDDEIEVDGYVMKPEVRGTSRDPRALPTEQWVVKVRLVEGRLQFNVPVDRAHWEKVKPGDRVMVTYSQGKYTGTVWGAELK
jgi:hypothetical protein